MLLFAKKFLIFSIPFLIIMGIEILIDPFNYFGPENDRGMQELKEEISQKKNKYLYRLIEYDRNPTSIIILGDSRDAKLTPSLFKDITDKSVTNLAGGGGSLQDMIEIFWGIAKSHKLEKVYMGISLLTYNGILLKDRVSEAIKIKNSLPLYLTNRTTLESTALICKSKITGEKIDIEKPPFDREEFWKYQLEHSARFYSTYSYPQNYFRELKEISDYCFKNKIELVFCISPTHVDLQKKIDEFGLRAQREKLVDDMRMFGDVYDFDYENAITKNKDLFGDPYHVRDSIPRVILTEIALHKPRFAKYYKCARKNI